MKIDAENKPLEKRRSNSIMIVIEKLLYSVTIKKR